MRPDGNDDDTVDTLLARAYQTYIDELNSTIIRATVVVRLAATITRVRHYLRTFGAQTMATPDGRKADTPLAEGASLASGTDHLGPTAGDRLGGETAYGSDSRRRVAQPETESGNAGERI
ncbi:hypothetical protein ACLBOM_24760 [Escherichia coli]